MSTLDEIVPAATAEPIAAQAVLGRWDRVESLLVRLGEKLNPILVKEARQAMKGKQFVITFGLLLFGGWIWTLWGIALAGPGVEYQASGGSLFLGYYVLLALPLLVIVPYGSFRSLASECEDRTFELLTITTLSPRQIVSGKLASAVLQMLVYFSALAPCLVFTYLLRGIDMPTILFILLYTFAASLALSLIALFLATVAQERHWQIVLSVLLVMGLGLSWWASIAVVDEMLPSFYASMYDSEFWPIHGLLGSLYLTYAALIFLAAAAQLTFPSENRSTPIRIAMLSTQIAVAGWATWMTAQEFNRMPAVAWILCIGFLGGHWYVLGSFMSAESASLSPRVKRRLPQSFFGRAFLTWFNPGPATGYMFVLTNILAAGFLGIVIATIATWIGSVTPLFAGAPTIETLVYMIVVLTCYLAIYLGIGRILIGLLRRITSIGFFVSLVLHLFLVLAGCLVPMFIEVTRYLDVSGYTLLHISNPFWTIGELVDRGAFLQREAVTAILTITAGVVFAINLPPILREVRQVRLAPPRRVEEDDAQLAAALNPAPAPVRTSPWD